MNEKNQGSEKGDATNPLEPNRRGFFKAIASVATAASGNSPIVKALDSITPISTLYPTEILPYLRIAADAEQRLIQYYHDHISDLESANGIERVQQVVRFIVHAQEQRMPMLDYINHNPQLDMGALFDEANRIYEEVHTKSLPANTAMMERYDQLLVETDSTPHDFDYIDLVYQWEREFQDNWLKEHNIDRNEYELMKDSTNHAPNIIESSIIQSAKAINWTLANYIHQQSRSQFAFQEVSSIINSAYDQSLLPKHIIDESKKFLWEGINDLLKTWNFGIDKEYKSQKNERNQDTEALQTNEKHTQPDAMNKIAEGYGQAAKAHFIKKFAEREAEKVQHDSAAGRKL
jgi:hypothetical protein